MLAIHDQFTRQMRNRLKTTIMGLGLVRLLQDARRFEEARTTLYTLENEFQGGAVEPAKLSAGVHQDSAFRNADPAVVHRLNELVSISVVALQFCQQPQN